ncbi:hypothetical protein GS429_05935 [Natronorubrum sp. JWXQ-INN-674]|uniref:Uncharacterized protein n=1 Tax=Natronorubrum halalkaliphilum TaxID=2691917 RepID=A0A6B0VLH3_9EURY|nr:hypothetical protein [Natronorubrum halalkaliphilum]
MIEPQTHHPTSNSTATETAFVVSFSESTNNQERRIRYVKRQDNSQFWRVDESRHDGSWQVETVEPIENLQCQQPDITDALAPKAESAV